MQTNPTHSWPDGEQTLLLTSCHCFSGLHRCMCTPVQRTWALCQSTRGRGRSSGAPWLPGCMLDNTHIWDISKNMCHKLTQSLLESSVTGHQWLCVSVPTFDCPQHPEVHTVHYSGGVFIAVLPQVWPVPGCHHYRGAPLAPQLGHPPVWKYSIWIISVNLSEIRWSYSNHKLSLILPFKTFKSIKFNLINKQSSLVLKWFCLQLLWLQTRRAM